MSGKNTSIERNRLLGALPAGDLALLLPLLEFVELRERVPLEEPNRVIDHAYFIETGLASAVATSAGSLRIEVGLIGCEGMSGVAAVLGNLSSPNATYMQTRGTAKRIAAGDLRAAMDRSATLRGLLLRYAQVFLVQTAQTAATNAKARLEERLARWLLMAHDRTADDHVQLTHEILSLMLGVRRASVTEALHGFEERGQISCRRGVITVLDRDGIQKVAGRFYGVPEAEYRRLIG